MMSEFNKQLQRLVKRFDKLSLRERVVILIALLVLSNMAWNQWLWQPLTASQQQLDQQIQEANSGLQLLNVQLKGMVNRSQKDPDVEIRRQIARMDTGMRQLDQQIREAAASLISPEQMSRLLGKLLVREGVLQLVRLENLPPVPLIIPEETGQQVGDAVEGPLPNIYRHGFLIEFEGDYFSTLAYLKSLEALPWKFFWDGVDFQVTKYPQARVRVRLHTMSLNKGWVGV